MSREERLQGLQVDVDTRIAELWTILWDDRAVLASVMQDDTERDSLGALLRAAYSMGYMDALKEDALGFRGELAKAHGYEHP
jgi:hypothetical protein